MEEKLKEVNNQDLLQIYRLILEHLEYLQKEKEKVEADDKNDWGINK